MAVAYKILGQSAPSTTSNVDLITVAVGKSVVISTINIANVTTSAATYRIFARIGGTAAGVSNAIDYDITVLGNSSIKVTIGATLAAADVLTVQSGTANSLTFTAFGSEIS